MSVEETPSGELDTGLTPEEQASVEVGQRGFSEPTNVNVPPPTGPQRPEWCPEQFWKDGAVDTEGLAKSYGSLRSKMDGGQKAEETPGEPTEAAPASADGKIAIDDAGSEEGEAEGSNPVTGAIEAAAAGFDYDTGSFSEEAIEALEGAGIPKAIADIYAAGLQALAQRDVAELHSYVGGEEHYNAMIAWAKTGLNAEQIEAFNTALDNPAMRENAVLGLNAKFTAARPSEGKLVTPQDAGAGSADVFTSRDELVAAQKDPRYSTDAGYRQSVIDKLARSQASNGFKAFDRPMFQREIIST